MTPAAPHPGDPVTAVTGRRASAGSISTRRRIVGRLLGAAIAALVLLASLSTMGGTYAFWSDETSLEAGTVTTGSASLEAALDTDQGELHAQNLLPGDEVPHQVTLRNSGDVPLAVSVTATGTINGVSHELAIGLDAPAAGSALLGELGVGESRIVDLTVIAPDALGPESAMDIALEFEGKQIR